MEKNDSRLIFFLLLGLATISIIGAVQFYYTMRIVYDFTELGHITKELKIIFPFFFFLFTILFFARYGVIMFFAFLEAAKNRLTDTKSNYSWPSVSVLVPAHNEGIHIENTLQSLLAVDYPRLEILVVDDGSTDDTYAKIKAFAGAHGDKIIKVFRKEQGGKASALNVALHYSTGHYIVSMDADSQLAVDSIKILLRRFDDEKVGACAGQVVIQNRRNLLTYLQSLEYMLMNGTGRMFQSYFQSVLIAPGPLTMFRKNVLDELTARQLLRNEKVRTNGSAVPGPWETDTFAEDAKLSLALLSTGVDIVYEPRAICHTSAPLRAQKLLNQRYRWTRGNLQAIRRTWDLWCQRPNDRPNLGIWLTLFVVESVFWPLIDVASLIIFVLLVVTTGGMGAAYIWYLLLILADISSAAFAATNSYQRYSTVFFIPIYRAYYGVLLEINALFAITDEIRGLRMRW